MAGFIKNLVNYVKEAFDDEDEMDRPAQNESSFFDMRGERDYENMYDDVDTDSIDVSNFSLEDTNLDYEDTDTDNIGVTSDFKKEPQDPADYSEYWWCFVGNADEEIPVYSQIDPEKVQSELHKRVEAGQFPIIEIPENAMKAIELLNNPEFDFAAVAHLINKSPAMAGEFLSLVNSSSYSRGVKISDLRVALPRVGRENVKAMLYLYSTKMSIAASAALNDLAVKIVDHSYATAITASYLSQRYFPDPDTAFLSGLMHDVGKLGIIKGIAEDYAEIKDVKGDLMEEHFGTTFPELHEKIGVNLAKRWGIDELVISAIEHHHDFFAYGFDYDEQEQFSLSALINLSDIIAKILGKGRQVDAVNIFDLAATRELNIEMDKSTMAFLDELPGIISFKSSQ